MQNQAAMLSLNQQTVRHNNTNLPCRCHYDVLVQFWSQLQLFDLHLCCIWAAVKQLSCSKVRYIV